MSDRRLSRRALLGAAAAVPAAAGLHSLISRGGIGGEAALADPAASNGAAGHAGHDRFAHASFASGRSVNHRANGFDPTEVCATSTAGKTKRLASGRLLREWTLVAQDKEIEVAPGVKYEAWTYNGRVPGPTLRAREGEKLRIRLVNSSEPPAHDPLPRHPPVADGRYAGDRRAPGGGQIEPGEASPMNSTPSPSASTSTTATSRRSLPTSPAASTAPSSSTRRRVARKRTRW